MNRSLSLSIISLVLVSLLASAPALGAPPKKEACPQGSFFVGLALSGGGPRATAFAHGVIQGLREVEMPKEIGLSGSGRKVMDRVGAISAVSGGALAAAEYYVNPRRESAQFVRGMVSTDAFGVLLPKVQARAARDIGWFGLTVGNLFKWKGFVQQEMFASLLQPLNLRGAKVVPPPGKPRFLITATNLNRKGAFIFPDHLKCLGYRPNEFPLETALAASAALPGLVEPVELKLRPKDAQALEPGVPDECRVTDLHAENTTYLSDGGLVDNLGIVALIREIAYLKNERQCPELKVFLFLVNAEVKDSLSGSPSSSVDVKDVLLQSFDRLIIRQSRSNIDVLKNFLSSYGVTLYEFRIDDLGLERPAAQQPFLSRETLDQVERWGLVGNPPPTVVEAFVDATREMVKARARDFGPQMVERWKSRVVDTPQEISGDTSKQFLRWREDWRSDTLEPLAVMANRAYGVARERARLEAEYKDDKAKYEAKLAELGGQVGALVAELGKAGETKKAAEDTIQQLRGDLEKLDQTSATYRDKVAQLSAENEQLRKSAAAISELSEQLAETRTRMDALMLTRVDPAGALAEAPKDPPPPGVAPVEGGSPR